MSRTNLKIKVGLNKFNKVRTVGIIIEKDIKAGAKIVIGTLYIVNSGIKISDQHEKLIGLAIATLAMTNYANNFYFAIFVGLLWGIITSIPNNFLAIFAVFANTSLEKKTKVCEFN